MVFPKILKNTIQTKNKKILIFFDDMISDMLSNKKLSPIVNGLYFRGRKLNISLFLLHNLILICEKILE